MAIKKLGLVPRLLLAIFLGIIYGQLKFLPSLFFTIPVTLSAFFSAILSFIIPLMVVAFVVSGISDLSAGAGKLLGLTTGLSYLSTIIGGTVTLVVISYLFPLILNQQTGEITAIEAAIDPLFTIPLEPILDVTQAIILAFLMGLGISWLRQQGNNRGTVIHQFFADFSDIISYLLKYLIVPGIPIFVFGNFVNLSYSGSVFYVLSAFWKVYLIILFLHWIYMFVWFSGAGLYSGKRPLQLIKNQLPAYLTAVGTQSSAATIPINLETAKKNGVSEVIRDFVIPFCATAHMLGSITTITSIVYAVLLLNQMPVSFTSFLPFIFVLGVAMVAAPGAPGGAIMSALPFLGMVGIDPSGTLASLLISLYLTQDSFGTALNISGDNAIALVVDKIYHKHILEETID